VSDATLTSLAALTTLRVGGPAAGLVTVSSEEELVEAVSEADGSGDALLVLAGGSNLVVADEGFPGTVVRVALRGLSALRSEDSVALTVAAGEPWDGVVGDSVSEGWSGLEALSGIPGLTGATPMQNVGAYGQEVSQTVTAVRAYDRADGAIVELSPADLDFAYRTSALRGGSRYVVLNVTFRLGRDGLSAPVRYGELARVLDLEAGDQAPLADVREAVLGLRRAKGMVIDENDPDSVSAGSFFTNPILDAEAFARLRDRVRDRLGDGVAPPEFPESDGRIKTSAAWLIERAGFQRGHGSGRVGLSTKHTLAIVNRGGATAAEIVAFAETIAGGVREAFGVGLSPEPILVGLSWPDGQ
jgi:UDP-N-acetylmuramate dehydrogenase